MVKSMAGTKSPAYPRVPVPGQRLLDIHKEAKCVESDPVSQAWGKFARRELYILYLFMTFLVTHEDISEPRMERSLSMRMPV